MIISRMKYQVEIIGKGLIHYEISNQIDRHKYKKSI